MKVFIIRHGHTLVQQKDVVLSKKGNEEAYKTGIWLNEYFKENEIDISNIQILYSPLTRTRQTKDLINTILGITNQQAVEQLREQEYGIFEGLTANEQRQLYPNLYKEYLDVKEEKGRFYAKFPEGESPEDVSRRINTIVQDVKKISKTRNVIIISHATAIKCFLLKWFDYLPDNWYKNEPIPKNCSVRLIDNNNDYDYIYEP